MKDTSTFKTDSLINVDEIVDRYMADVCKNNQQKTSQYVWSEPLDDVKKTMNEIKLTSKLGLVFDDNISKLCDDSIISSNNKTSKNNFNLTEKLDFSIDKEHVEIKKESINSKPKTNKLDLNDNIISKNADFDSMLDKLESNFNNTKKTKPLKDMQISLNTNQKTSSLNDEYKKTMRMVDNQEKVEYHQTNKLFDDFDFEEKKQPTRNINLNKTIDFKIDDSGNKYKINTSTSEYDEKINDSFKQKFTSQLLKFDSHEKVTSVPTNQKHTNHTKYFFTDTKELDLTKPINYSDKITFNTSNRKFGEKKTKSLGFFQKSDKTNVLEEQRANKKIQKQKRKITWKSLPGFYRFEHFIAVATLLISILIFLASLACLIYVLVQVFNFSQSYWLFFPQTIFNIFGLGFLIFSIFNLSNIRKELKFNNYYISNEAVTPFIKRKYKSLCSSYIVLNWTALSSYVVGGLLILMMYIVAYFHNLVNAGINNFGYLTINGNDNVLNIILWSVVSVMIFFATWQVISFTISRKRKSEIELFYQKDILTDEMIQKYKKSANRKGLVIFLISTLVISLAILIIWLVFRKISISNIIKK